MRSERISPVTLEISKHITKHCPQKELAAENVGATLVDVARNRGAYADLGNKGYKGDEMRLYPAWKATDGDGHVTGTSGVKLPLTNPDGALLTEMMIS